MPAFLRLLLFFGLLHLYCLGQQKTIPINISLFNESTAIPFTRLITTPIHPGIQIGTEFQLKSGTKTRSFLTANASYFYHNYQAQGIGLHGEFGFEYRHQSGIAASGLMGLGYMHTFSTTEEFNFSNGQYIQKPDAGNARLFPSVSLDLGYYLNRQEPSSPKVFLRYQPWVEFPYSPGFIPVLTHINLHAGVKIFIGPKP